MQQVKFAPLADITPRMSGTSSTWPFPVESVFVNGVSTPFTWSTNGDLSIPSYSVGTVLVQFTLYLLHDNPSTFLPLDPTDPVTEEVYWENRLRNFVSFSSSIKAFESGLTEINIGTLTVQLDDEWKILTRYQLIMPNSVIRIYNDGQIVYKGIATRHSVSEYAITINIQKRISVFDSECNFGDPEHLCRIDRSTNTSYYNGANIPEQYEGWAIPMLFGNEFPYDQSDYSEIEVGPANQGHPAWPNNAHTKFSQKAVNTGAIMVQVIPTSATTGIIGRMPSFQTFVSSPGDVHIFSAGFPVPNPRFYKKDQSCDPSLPGPATIAPFCIPGEIAFLQRLSGTSVITGQTASRIWLTNKTNQVRFFLGAEDDDDAAFDVYTDVLDYSQTEHWFCNSIPSDSWTLPAPSFSLATPGGNKFITANFTGIDLRATEVFVVFTGMTGAKNNFDLMQWILEQHGFTVDSASFASLNSAFPVKTIQQVGQGQSMPTLGQLIAEMNQSLMTILVFPADNDVPFIKLIDPEEPATLTLTEKEIRGLSVNSEYRDQARTVQFHPKYARSDVYKTSLYRSMLSDNRDLFASQRTVKVDHVLADAPAEVITRWQEMTQIYGTPGTQISFELLDQSIEIDVGQRVNIDHDLFSGVVLIISVEQKQQGRSVQGRYFYVNNI